MHPPALSPSNQTPPGSPQVRTLGLDVARGLAILGMVTVHFTMVILGVEGSAGSPTLAFLDGRAAMLFMILAGIGVTLMARAHGDKAPAAFLKRGALLLLLGFANLILWQGDILRVYGLSFLLAAFLATRKSWTLIGIAISIFAAFVVALLFTDYGANWNWETLTYSGVWSLSGCLRNLFYDGFRSFFPWASFFIFGIVLGRCDLRSTRTQTSLIVLGGLFWALAQISSRLLLRAVAASPEIASDPEFVEFAQALFGTASMPPLFFFGLSSVGLAMFLLGLCLMMANRFENNVLILAGAATGQLAFTWYVFHVYFGVFILDTLEITNRGESFAVLISIVYCVALAGISYYWRKSGKRGPLEHLLRRASRAW